MARSQNGWIANDRSLIRTYTVPESRVRVAVRKGDVATVLLHVMAWVDQHVEDIDTRRGVRGFDVPDDWGYAERPIRGGQSLSNHASGTAVDVNAVQHPLGVRGTWSRRERKKIHGMLAQLDGVVRWGEDYRSRADGMHFEINAGPAAVAKVAAKLRIQGTASEDKNAMIHASYGLTISQPLPWDTWTRLLWDIDYSGAKRNRTPGHVADLTGWAVHLGLEGLEVQGLRPARIDDLGSLVAADQLQVRLEVYDWKNGEAHGAPWVEMADDRLATPGGQFPSTFKSKWLTKGQHVYWSVCARPGDERTDRTAPAAVRARYTVHQEER